MFTMEDTAPKEISLSSIHLIIGMVKLLIAKGVLTKDDGINLFTKCAETFEDEAAKTRLERLRQTGNMLRKCEAHLLEELK
jgi:hypothetical protein